MIRFLCYSIAQMKSSQIVRVLHFCAHLLEERKTRQQPPTHPLLPAQENHPSSAIFLGGGIFVNTLHQAPNTGLLC